MAKVVPSTLLDRYPALVGIDELTAELTIAGPDQTIPPSSVVDGIVELGRCGLIHRVDAFIFASWAAVRASELAE